jgi:two-component system, cell cycle sensor histidine kinase and response regulator CckA
MQDQYKTREQLIDELNKLRRKVDDIGDAGKVNGLACLIDDITHLKLVEQKLRESEQRLQLALEGGALGLWDWNLKTGRAVWSEWAIRMLGYELDELDPHVRTWKRAVHSDDWERVSEVLNGHLSGRLPCFEAEYRIQTKFGEWKWVQARGKVTEYDNEGTPQRITGTMLDFTERRKAAEELRKSEEKYRRLVENAYDIVYTTDPNGRVTFVNPSGLQHIRYSQEEVVGRCYLEFIPEEYVENVSQFYSHQFLEKIPDTYFEFPFVTKNGEIRWYGQKTQLLTEHDSIVGFQSIARDITDRRRLEEERLEMERRLLHAQKIESLGLMAGGIAHDFNNQLAVVLGNLELALTDKTLDAETHLSIEGAVKAARKSAELSRQMQTYTGTTLYSPVNLDLNELLSKNFSQLESCISRNVTLNLERSNSLPLMRGDADQIQRLVMNLVVNASEAIEDQHGDVDLRTGVMDCEGGYLSRSRLEEKPASGRFIFLEVTDTGCGMDADSQRRLFDPFFTTKFTGRGLGMAEVIGVVKGHSGAIIVDSEIGKGTTIRVLFPVTNEPQASTAKCMERVEIKLSANDAANRKKTILLVEDETGVRDLVVRRLDKLGYSAITAVDGEEGIGVFQERLSEIDLVMLDFAMPKMNGVEAFRELIRIKPDVKVILSSGYTEDVLLQSFPDRRPAGVLHKPYKMEALKAKLDRLLENDG